MADAIEIDPEKVRDLSPEALADDGRVRVLPAAFWAATTREERALFGHLNATYSFPTVELVEHLRELIGDRHAIEIGAGHGVLAEALGIPATDNRMQERSPYREFYATTGQPAVAYGPNVEELDAMDAVHKYRPEVVIACWVTHRWDPRRPQAGGNEIGVDEGRVVTSCQEYVLIGNTHTHRNKDIWTLPHEIEYPSFVYSRAHNGTRDFVATWGGTRPGQRQERA